MQDVGPGKVNIKLHDGNVKTMFCWVVSSLQGKPPDESSSKQVHRCRPSDCMRKDDMLRVSLP